MKYIFIFIIRIYQFFLSFDHGIPSKIFPKHRICYFYPSCSEYTAQALEKYGTIKGLWMGAKRIVRCGPWSWDKSPWDPVK